MRKKLMTAAAAAAFAGAGFLAVRSFDHSNAAEHTDPKAVTQAGSKAKKAAEPAQADATAAGTPADNPLVTQAKQAGVKSCLKQIRKESDAIQTDYAVFSTWALSAPDAHVFQSVLSMAQRDQQIGRSFGILLAAPTGQGCDSASLQVAPVPMGCDAIQADRTKDGHPLEHFAFTRTHILSW